jgi:hypothetical protein
MKQAELDQLEKLMGQMEGLHREVSALSKKSSNDALNKFKLRFVNSIIAEANAFLGDKNKPFSDFGSFDVDDVPSTSDVTMIVTQYIEALELLRVRNLKYDYDGRHWYYSISGGEQVIGAPPRRISEKKS